MSNAGQHDDRDDQEDETPEGAEAVTSTIMTYLIRNVLTGVMVHGELIDTTQGGMIFQIDKQVVEQGFFDEIYIDSREFLQEGWEIVPVFRCPDSEN